MKVGMRDDISATMGRILLVFFFTLLFWKCVNTKGMKQSFPAFFHIWFIFLLFAKPSQNGCLILGLWILQHVPPLNKDIVLMNRILLSHLAKLTYSHISLWHLVNIQISPNCPEMYYKFLFLSSLFLFSSFLSIYRLLSHGPFYSVHALLMVASFY